MICCRSPRQFLRSLYQDPVMPGSLGVEAILQAPHREQQMRLEVHLKRIERSATQISLLGDASLWREELRIYHVTDIALAIVDG